MQPFLMLCPDRKQFVVLLARELDLRVSMALQAGIIGPCPCCSWLLCEPMLFEPAGSAVQDCSSI
jgi:hypothetical protein